MLDLFIGLGVGLFVKKFIDEDLEAARINKEKREQEERLRFLSRKPTKEELEESERRNEAELREFARMFKAEHE